MWKTSFYGCMHIRWHGHARNWHGRASFEALWVASGGTAVHDCGTAVPKPWLCTFVHMARPCFNRAWPCLSYECAHLWTWHGRASVENSRAWVSILVQNCNGIHFKTLETILTCIIQMKGKKFNTRTTYIENKHNT